MWMPVNCASNAASRSAISQLTSVSAESDQSSSSAAATFCCSTVSPPNRSIHAIVDHVAAQFAADTICRPAVASCGRSINPVWLCRCVKAFRPIMRSKRTSPLSKSDNKWGVPTQAAASPNRKCSRDLPASRRPTRHPPAHCAPLPTAAARHPPDIEHEMMALHLRGSKQSVAQRSELTPGSGNGPLQPAIPRPIVADRRPHFQMRILNVCQRRQLLFTATFHLQLDALFVALAARLVKHLALQRTGQILLRQPMPWYACG